MLPKKRRLPLAFLGAAALLVPAGLALSGRTYAGSDLPTSYFPHFEILRRGIADTGSIPLWDFYEFGGTPFLGNLLDGVFYPPNVLFLLFPVPRALELLVALHLALAAFGMYRLARSYRLSREACTLAGCAFTLSLTVMSRVGAGHYGAFVTLSQAPLLLFLIRNVVRKPTLRSTLLLGLGAAALPLAGHPPFVYQLGLLAAGFAGVELLAVRSERARALRALGLLAGAALLAVLIDAALLIPAAEVRAHASRTGLAARDLASERNPDASWLPRDFSSFLIPFYPRKQLLGEGKWETYFCHEKAVYAGLLPLLWAAFALVGAGRKGVVFFFAAVGVLAIADGMSLHLPLHRAAAALLPGYQAFRVPARSVWVCGLAMSLLAAFGMDRWRPAPASWRARFLGGAALLAGLVLTTLLLRFGFHAELLLAAASFGIAAAILWGLRERRAVALAAVAATFLDLAGQAAGMLPTLPQGLRIPTPWYLSHLGPDPSPYRVLDAGMPWIGYAPATSGVRLIDGTGYPILKGTRDFFGGAWETPPEPRFETMGTGKRVADPERLDALNVGWIVWIGEPPETGLLPVARQGDSVLYRRPTAEPYATAARRPVEVRRRGSDLSARVTLAGAETLVVRESWMPGWRVEVDGVPGRVIAHRGVHLGVALTAGEHEVRFRYDPASYRVGRWVSGLTLAGTLAALAVAMARERRSRA